MSEKINDGGPAFPGPCQSETMVDINEGLSLRDYFAAKALGGIANQVMLENAITDDQCESEIINAAALSYRLADAMIKVRQS